MQEGGLAVTAESDDAIGAINAVELLSQSKNASVVMDAAATHPDAGLLQAYAAAL